MKKFKTNVNVLEGIYYHFKKYKFITEIPINYYPRTNTDGKKINLYDFFHAIDVILKFRFGIDRSHWTLLKLVGLVLGSIVLFGLVLWILMQVGFYQDHNYYSIGLALFVADLFAYRVIKMMFFGGTRIALLTFVKDYFFHSVSLLVVYFASIYYFVKIAQGVWLYQWLFFVVLSILMVSGSTFLANLLKGLRQME